MKPIRSLVLQETDEEGQVKLNDSDTLTVSVDLKKKRRVKFPVGSAKQESEQAQIDRVRSNIT